MAPSGRPALVAARTLALLALIWAALVPAAPRLRCAGGWPGRLATIAYVSGAIVCHQKSERSFVSAGLPWPVCARCSGVYLAAGATNLLLALPIRWRKRLARPARDAWRAAFGGALLVVALTWLVERAGVLTMSNSARALSGVPLGVVIAAVLSIAGGTASTPPVGSRDRTPFANPR